MRTEIIKADNSNHVITITKKEEEITIEFDFELVPEMAPRFTLPLWEKKRSMNLKEALYLKLMIQEQGMFYIIF